MENKPLLELSYHRTDWIFEYTKAVKRFREIIPSKIKVCFMHVGSTAAHAVTARPIIDIAIGVINPLDLITVRDILALNGYEPNESRSTISDLFLEKKNKAEQRFNIHVVVFDGPRWNDMFKYTQYLKENPNAAKEFSLFKTDLIVKKKVSREVYEREKANYIKEILKKI